MGTSIFSSAIWENKLPSLENESEINRDYANISIEKHTNGFDADVSLGPELNLEDTILWEYMVTNTGNITGDHEDITVTDKDAYIPTGSFIPVGDDVKWEYVAIDIEKFTNGEDADTPTGPFIPVGDNVEWEYVVTNTGNVPLSNIVVTDDQGVTVTCPQTTLAVGESMTCTASGTAEVGQYANIGKVTGEHNGIIVGDEDPSHYSGAAPAIDIEKSTNGEDADFGPGPKLSVGDDILWEYIVTNTGNVPLENVVVTDDQGAVPQLLIGDDGDGILQLDEVWIYEATGTAECGQYANIGKVTGDYEDITVMDEDPSSYFCETPDSSICDIDIEKSTNGFDADSAPGPELNIGDDVVWVYVVTNTGNVNLNNIVVTDNQGVVPIYLHGDNNGDGILQPSEVWIYEAKGTAECGQYENIGAVTGNGISMRLTVEDEDSSNYLVECQPNFNFEMYTNGEDADVGPGPKLSVGDDILWEYIVTNTGNVPLSNIVVTDDQGMVPVYQSGDDGDNILQNDEVWIYIANGVVSECPINYMNLGQVTGEYNGISVSDTDTSSYFCEASDFSLPEDNGGDGPVGEAYENIQKKEVISQFISKGEISYEFKEDVNSIDYIKFEALKNSGKINATIEVLKDRSSMVNSDPDGKVYQYMNIWVGETGFATEQNITNPLIRFRVKKAWIYENNIDESTIKLNRCHNSEWNQLPTTKTEGDGEYLHFEAKTSCFSPFAITGFTKEEPEAEDDTPEQVDEDTLVDTTTEAEDDTLEQVDEDTLVDTTTEAEEEPKNGPGFLSLSSILATLCGYLVLKKHHK